MACLIRSEDRRQLLSSLIIRHRGEGVISLMSVLSSQLCCEIKLRGWWFIFRCNRQNLRLTQSIFISDVEWCNYTIMSLFTF